MIANKYKLMYFLKLNKSLSFFYWDKWNRIPLNVPSVLYFFNKKYVMINYMPSINIYKSRVVHFTDLSINLANKAFQTRLLNYTIGRRNIITRNWYVVIPSSLYNKIEFSFQSYSWWWSMFVWTLIPRYHKQLQSAITFLDTNR